MENYLRSPICTVVELSKVLRAPLQGPQTAWFTHCWVGGGPSMWKEKQEKLSEIPVIWVDDLLPAHPDGLLYSLEKVFSHFDSLFLRFLSSS